MCNKCNVYYICELRGFNSAGLYKQRSRPQKQFSKLLELKICMIQQDVSRTKQPRPSLSPPRRLPLKQLTVDNCLCMVPYGKVNLPSVGTVCPATAAKAALSASKTSSLGTRVCLKLVAALIHPISSSSGFSLDSSRISCRLQSNT